MGAAAVFGGDFWVFGGVFGGWRCVFGEIFEKVFGFGRLIGYYALLIIRFALSHGVVFGSWESALLVLFLVSLGSAVFTAWLTQASGRANSGRYRLATVMFEQ